MGIILNWSSSSLTDWGHKRSWEVIRGEKFKKTPIKKLNNLKERAITEKTFQ